MRFKIWQKGDFFQFIEPNTSFDMDPDVVELPEQIPLTWNYRWEMQPFGVCRDLRLEDGEITAEVQWFDAEWDDDSMEEHSMRLGGYYQCIESVEGVDGKRGRVTKAVLRGAAVIPIESVPGYEDIEIIGDAEVFLYDQQNDAISSLTKYHAENLDVTSLVEAHPKTIYFYANLTVV